MPEQDKDDYIINDDADDMMSCIDCIGGIIITTSDSEPIERPVTNMHIRHATKSKLELLDNGSVIVLNFTGDSNGNSCKKCSIELTRSQAESIAMALTRVLG